MPFFSRSTLPSIRSKTAMLVLACALPTVAALGLLSYDSYQREHEHMVHDAEQFARALMLAVDRDLDNGEAAARALASSPSIASADLAAFHAQARSVLQPGLSVYSFVLSTPGGQPLLDTRRDYGAPLPSDGNAARIRRVAATGQVLTSDLFGGGPDQPQLVSVDIPVARAGQVAYVLSVRLQPAHMGKLLEDLRLAPGWTVQVFDASHTIVARNLNPQRTVGASARPAMSAEVRRATSGVIEMTSREGVHVLSAFHRSEKRGWFVSVGVPRNAPHQILADNLARILLGVALLLTVGFGTAWTIGGAIGRSVRALRPPAVALGRGEALDFPPLHIREAAEVADALRQVEGELLRYRSGLEELVRERTVDLERANAMLEAVHASAPLGLCLLDRELRVVKVNAYLAAINARPIADHIGRTLPEILGSAGLAFEEPYRHVLETGTPLIGVESSGEVPANPGVERYWNVSYYPLFGPGGEVEAVSSVVIDVSERRQIKERLRDNEEQFRVLYEMSADAHMMVAVGAGFVGGNMAAASLFGCDSIDDFLTLSPATASPEFQPDGMRSAEKAAQYMRRALQEGRQHFEWVHRRRDGSLFDADVLVSSINIGGTGILVATVRDISARTAAEAALRATGEQLARSESFIRTITDNLPGMVAYWDAALRCRFANRSYLEWAGRTLEDSIGRPMSEVVGARMAAENAPYLQRTFAGVSQHFARELARASGEPMHAWCNYIPDIDDTGKVRGVFVLVSDITEQKRNELRLQTLNEQLLLALDTAEMASSAKSEFVANMSHEIRTPMNAIMGLARLLDEAPLAPRERAYVAKMKMSTQSLLGILNDVLDFSKIEAGQLALESMPFRLDQVLASISVLTSPQAWEKQVEPVFAVAPGVPLELVGDPMRLEQILLNLVGNAIKFTERGEVVLAIRTLSTGAHGVRLEFSVSDTGIGIAPDQRQRMFEAFSQGDTSTSRKYGGTGLGLAICRRLADLMGGAISVDSELGKGSTFRVVLQFAAAAGSWTETVPKACAMDGLSVLVVDDSASSAAAIAACCAALGCQVELAHSGAAALELLRGARRREKPYDLLFLDSALPDLDGISVLTYARADRSIALPRFALLIPETERERLDGLARDLQLDTILSKPVTPSALLHAIVDLRSASPAAPVGRAAAPLAGRLQGIHVLLVEDNQINQEVANYILLHAGARVDVAANGRIALSMLADDPARYDAVLMDIQMPVMNGYEATASIRDMGLSKLPVIAMTANAMESDRRQAIEAGMNAHIAKPVDVDALIATLNRLTSGGAERDLRRAAGAPPASARLPAAIPATIPGIDLQAALARFDGDFAAYAAIFKRFEASQGGTLDEVRTLLAGGERHAAIALVHRLRGVAANLGASSLAALALEFEQALRCADDAELALRLVTLEAALRTVFDSAATLALPEAPSRQAPLQDPDTLDDALAILLGLLQNNNLKAMSQFEALRGALGAVYGADTSAALADAIETLVFTNASALVQDLLNRRESA